MKLNLTVDEVLSTTRSVRKRLDMSKPVPRQVIEECLELALQAPNGSNRNDWRWVVVDDKEKIAKLGNIYRATMADINRAYRMDVGIDPHHSALMSSVAALVDSIDRAPAMVVPLMMGRAEGKSAMEQAAMWGSVIQAVWSLFLALRERGIGAAWTTITLQREREVADLLSIPFDQYTQVGLFPIAYTIGTDFKKAWRKPLSEVLTYNQF